MGNNPYQYNDEEEHDNVYGNHYHGSADTSWGTYGTPPPFPSYPQQKQFQPRPKQQVKPQQPYQPQQQPYYTQQPANNRPQQPYQPAQQYTQQPVNNRPQQTYQPAQQYYQQPVQPKPAQAQPQAAARKVTQPAKPRMSKDKALLLTRAFKRSLLVVSVATFATFSGIIATYQANASSSTKSTASSKTTATQQKSSSFLQQQGSKHIAATPTVAATVQPTATVAATPTPVPTQASSNTGNTQFSQGGGGGAVGGSSVS